MRPPTKDSYLLDQVGGQLVERRAGPGCRALKNLIERIEHLGEVLVARRNVRGCQQDVIEKALTFLAEGRLVCRQYCTMV